MMELPRRHAASLKGSRFAPKGVTATAAAAAALLAIAGAL